MTDTSREALIKELRAIPNEWTSGHTELVVLSAADMLDADGKAQQVAVPDERAELLHHISGHIGWANRMDYAALSETFHRVHDMLEDDKREPLSDKEVIELIPGMVDCLCDPYDKQSNGDDYSSVPVDMLRLARAIEAHHGIKAKP